MKTLVLLLLLTPGLAHAATGTARVVHADLLSGQARFDLYVEPDTGGQFLVSSGSKPDTRFHDGDRVLARQAPAKKGAKVAASPYWIIEPLRDRARAVQEATSGVHPTVFVILNFIGQPNTATKANAVAGIQRVVDYYTAVSHGAVSMKIDVVGPFDVPHKGGTCPMWSILARDADAAAKAAGVSVAGYLHKVYLMPVSPCGWSGLGTVGGNPSQAWINGNGADGTTTLVHELGHNVTLWHSHSRVCVTQDIGKECATIEYGDFYDVMGGGGHYAHFNAAQKARLKWGKATRDVGAGTHLLTPFEATGDALRLARGTDALYVQYQPGKGDVTLHVQSPAQHGGGIALLIPENKVSMTVGRKWADVASGLTVTTTKIDAQGAHVTIGAGGAIVPPPPPPPPGDAIKFTRTKPKETFVLGPCMRLAGGTSVLHILWGGKIVARRSIPNPALGVPFTMSCPVTPTAITLSINGAVKLTATP